MDHCATIRLLLVLLHSLEDYIDLVDWGSMRVGKRSGFVQRGSCFDIIPNVGVANGLATDSVTLDE